jgi:hypothetical protein
MAQQLHDSCAAGEKKLILVEGGLHKDLFERPDAEDLVWEINRFATSLHCTPHVVQYQPGVGEQLLDHALRFIRRQWRRHPVHQPL